MPTLTVYIDGEDHAVWVDVYCSVCGRGLCDRSYGSENYRDKNPSLVVGPCEKCMEEEYITGYEKAKKENGEL